MATAFTVYDRRYRDAYASLFPERVLRTIRGGISIWYIRKGNKPHFRSFVREKLWREHREALAEKTFRRLAQKAQDLRFYQAELARRRAKKEALKEAGRFLYEQNMQIAESRKAFANNRDAEQAKRDERKAAIAAARRRRDDFLRKWKRIYGHLFEAARRSKRATEKRRDARVNSTTEKGVYAHIGRIQSRPVKCHWCRVFLPIGGHADHVVPLAKGGRHVVANLVPSCEACNRAKRDFMPDSREAGVEQLNFPMT